MAVARQHGLGLVAEALSGADQPIPIGQEPTDLAHGLRGHPHCRDCPDRQHLRETGRVDAIGVPARAQPLQFQGIGEQDLSRVWRKAVIDFEGAAGNLERDAALRPELRDQLGPTLRRGREPEMPFTMLRGCVRAPFAPVYIPVMQIQPDIARRDPSLPSITYGSAGRRSGGDKTAFDALTCTSSPGRSPGSRGRFAGGGPTYTETSSRLMKLCGTPSACVRCRLRPLVRRQLYLVP